jgi:hypothetical protein
MFFIMRGHAFGVSASVTNYQVIGQSCGVITDLTNTPLGRCASESSPRPRAAPSP